MHKQEEANRMLPGYAWISDIKKIDYMIWPFRE